MSLVPIIQPPLMRLFTTRAERRIRMEYAPRPVPRAAIIAFPIIVTVAVGVLVPASAPLVATLMFGNLLKESGVVPQLANAASSELANISTLFLGLTIGSLMQAATFLQTQTLFILLLGLIAFVLDTVAGLLFGKGLAVVTRGKINPLVGAAGISAFPMSGRLVQKVAQEEDFTNHVLMHAMGANTAGQLGSVIAGGVLLTLVELEPDTARMHPHELSGGMKQRVGMAIAVALRPEVIIADEPTSALDVGIQKRVMDTLFRVQQELDAAVILVGHDMGLMAQCTDRIGVMYAGRLVELGPVQRLFEEPLHPYTRMLVASLPSLERKGDFRGIPGLPPSLLDPPPGCSFHPRCPEVMERCASELPHLDVVVAGSDTEDGEAATSERRAACHLHSGDRS